MTTTTPFLLAAAPEQTILPLVKETLPIQPKDSDAQCFPDVNTTDSDTILSSSIAFVPEACLFCPHLSSDFDANLSHMQKFHGLFIPASIDDGSLHLAVNKETLVGYMHLVIFGYHECLLCGTQRADGWAARQHMIGKGHCRIDLDGVESEWRDFYESDHNLDSEIDLENEEEGEFEVENAVHNGADISSYGHMTASCDGDTLRLSSGKTVAHRTAPAPRNPQRKPLTGENNERSRRALDQMDLEDFLLDREQPSTDASFIKTDAANSLSTPEAAPPTSSSEPPPQSQALSRTDRRLLASNKSAVMSAVATMSKRDRAALMHLSPAQRRALVVGQFKQQERVHIAERKYWSKFERRQDAPAVGGKVYIGGG